MLPRCMCWSQAEVSRLEDADRAAASSTEVLTRQHRMEVAELRNQLDATRKQLETSEGAKQLLTRRVQQLQEQQTSVLEAQVCTGPSVGRRCPSPTFLVPVRSRS